MESSPLRILLIDGHQLFRSGLRLILERALGLAVVGEAGDAASALELAKSAKFDVILLNSQLPDGDGVELAGRILATCPAAKMLFLSSEGDFTRVRRALDAGGRGYLLKDSGPNELIQAIKAAANGGVCLSPTIAAELVAEFQRRIGSADGMPPARLSERETEVLRLISEGLRNKAIADHMNLSIKTVETYHRRLLGKLGCSSTAELVRYAIRVGLIAA
jgi:DNA-binding NarL/FixJ family response regulator